ncbi:MAG: imelysin family protein [Pseudomonadota bacterium]
MRALGLALAVTLLAPPAWAQPDHRAIASRTLDQVILPGTTAFHDAAEALVAAAPADCAAIAPEELRATFQATWDAWMRIEHLRFGPLEEGDRALQIAFWPDSRGTVGRTVERMLAAEDAVVDDPETFAQQSIGARGLPAMERLLYDDDGVVALEEPYRCRYIAAVAQDIARLAGEVHSGWHGPWAEHVRTAGEPDNPVFLAPAEVSQRLFDTVIGALELTARGRLERPLGTFQSPRPRLAEAWRAGRALRQIELVVEATDATLSASFVPELPEAAQATLAEAYAGLRQDLARVAEQGSLAEALTASRIRVEVLTQRTAGLANTIGLTVGPSLGITQGFNSADGD